MFTRKKMTINAVLLGVFLGLSAGPVYADWEVNVLAEIPDAAADTGVASSKLILGMGADGTDAFDNRWDTVALNSGALIFNFPHSEYSAEKARLWKDVRSEAFPKDWSLEMSSRLEGQARLTWNAETVPSHIDLRLIDEQSGASVDMKVSGEYAFTNSPSEVRKFTIHAVEKAPADESSGISPAPAVPPVSGGGASGGGGGCGTLKDVGRDHQGPSHPGTVAFNMAILFAPLFWWALRKVVLAGALRYSEAGPGSGRWI